MKKYVFGLCFLLFPLLSQAQNIQERLQKGELVLDTENIDIARITYDVYGAKDRPWIVLIHGLGGSRLSWSPVIQELAKDYRVLVYDQRGHGDNTIDRNNYSSSTMATDLNLLMETLKIERASLIGHSMGGRTAMRFASLYPNKVQNVIIEDMHAIGRSTILTDFTELANQIRPLYKPVFNSANEFYKTYQPYMRWRSKEDIFFFGRTRNVDGKFKFVLDFKPHVNIQYHNQGLQEDLTKALISIKAPITFLAAGREDSAVLFGKGIDHIKLNKPNAKIVVFSENGHSIHWENPNGFLQEVRSDLGKNLQKGICTRIFN